MLYGRSLLWVVIFFIHSANLCLLIGVSRPFTFRIIIDFVSSSLSFYYLFSIHSLLIILLLLTHTLVSVFFVVCLFVCFGVGGYLNISQNTVLIYLMFLSISLCIIFLLVALGITIYIYNLSQSTGI